MACSASGHSVSGLARNGGSSWTVSKTDHCRGNHMEPLTQPKTTTKKVKTKARTLTTTTPKEPSPQDADTSSSSSSSSDSEREMSACEVVCTNYFSSLQEEKKPRKRKIAEIDTQDHIEKKPNTKEHTKEQTKEQTNEDTEQPQETTTKTLMERVKGQRSDLESFLLTENNKISKTTIKTIMKRWGNMEAILHDLIIENEKLKATKEQYKSAPLSYSQAVASGKGMTCPKPQGSGTPTVPRPVHTKRATEVILVKPSKDNDKRTNEEIKENLTKELKNIRSKLHVVSIRQMRNKGVIVEVEGKQDIELIRGTPLQKAGLKLEEPKKQSPSLIIYDVEKEHTMEELKKDFITKNFRDRNEEQQNILERDITFRHSFKNKDDRMNWIVEAPNAEFNELIGKGRVYLMWGTYRVREFLNITRCFKCHGYGHVAKNCNGQDQLCETCGSKEHLKDKCKQKDKPKCINCIRAKKTETGHEVKSKNCPVYQNYVELVKTKINRT
ncbi:uncharacterized protein LOC122404356 [Colletes gigas]|uniref:uncharacterized protein LOC122404356 n=1 Tax=Colletes gigas TaxID=935657 RepID=UPI001C9B87CF|nr:uncharacterized protein LOC122404356 [Colletes gigas]